MKRVTRLESYTEDIKFTLPPVSGDVDNDNYIDVFDADEETLAALAKKYKTSPAFLTAIADNFYSLKDTVHEDLVELQKQIEACE